VPTALNELTSCKDLAKSHRVMEAMLKMVKLDIKKLKAAAKGK
jgi:predicted 3-demethylubiquinone-9 3-methyltransferase (glyoxalase superfamily)